MSKEKKYWEHRYATGGDSGWCSSGELRDWRWQLVEKNVDIEGKSVLDVGCGDLQFWEGKDHKDYTGLDISSVVIAKNRVLRPDWTFFLYDATHGFDRQFDVVFCFEMIFHIMTEERLIKIFNSLQQWTKDILFVTSWSKRPEPFVHPHYQHHWQIDDYLDYLIWLKLEKKYTTETGTRAMYVFRRIE